MVPENLKSQAGELFWRTVTLNGHFTIINFVERGAVRGIAVDEFVASASS